MRTSQRRNVLSIDDVRNVSSVGQMLKLTTLQTKQLPSLSIISNHTVLYVLNSIEYIYFLPIVIIAQNL